MRERAGLAKAGAERADDPWIDLAELVVAEAHCMVLPWIVLLRPVAEISHVSHAAAVEAIVSDRTTPLDSRHSLSLRPVVPDVSSTHSVSRSPCGAGLAGS